MNIFWQQFQYKSFKSLQVIYARTWIQHVVDKEYFKPVYFMDWKKTEITF
jgi:hypothetical protein